MVLAVPKRTVLAAALPGKSRNFFAESSPLAMKILNKHKRVQALTQHCCQGILHCAC
jgi:hypothetical protein